MLVPRFNHLTFRPIRFYFFDTNWVERIVNLDKPTDIKLPTDNPHIWVIVGKFKNKIEAIDYAMENYKADKFGNINILSQ